MAHRQTDKRRAELADIILSEGSYQIGTLAQRFGVSRETIRKDLIALEQEGIGQRGRNRFFAPQPLELPLDARTAEHPVEKQQIARAAVQMIADGSTVFLDSGSTTCEIARLLARRQGLTIVTNSATIPAMLARTGNTVISLGGELRGVSLAYVGMVALQALELFHADIAFVATSGFYRREGPCSANYAEAEVKRAMVRNAKQSVLVCDSSKFTADCAVQFCSWRQLCCIITDGGVSAAEQAALAGKVEIILAQ